MTRNKAILLGIILLDVMSLGILIPVLPAIFQSMTLPVISTNTQINTIIWYSLVIGFHPIGAFFSAPFLGTLSDRLGRKWVLVVAFCGSVLGYGLSIIGLQASSLLLLAVGRIIDGGTAGNIAVARAALLDIAEPEKRTQALGIVGALFGIGMVIGPLVGGAGINLFGLSMESSTLVFAAMLSFLSVVVTIGFFRETNTNLDTTKSIKPKLLPRLERELIPHILVSVLYVAGFGVFTTYWSLYLYTNFGMTVREVGYTFVFTGVCIAVVQGLVVRYVAQFIRPRRVLQHVMPLFALAAVLLAFVPREYLYIALAWFCLWNGLTMANRVSMISSYGTKYGLGYISGVDSAYTALAAAACPLLLGITSLFGIRAPFILIFVAIIIAWVMVLKYCYEYQEGIVAKGNSSE